MVARHLKFECVGPMPGGEEGQGRKRQVRTNLSSRWCGIHGGCTMKPLLPGSNTPGLQTTGEQLSAR